MRLGVATISGKGGSLPEICGSGARLVSTESGEELAEALRDLWTDEPLRQRLAQAGRERAAGFSWRKTAEETLAVYEAALV